MKIMLVYASGRLQLIEVDEDPGPKYRLSAESVPMYKIGHEGPYRYVTVRHNVFLASEECVVAGNGLAQVYREEL